MTTLLRIDASARSTGSITRELNDKIVSKFTEAGPVEVITRDVAQAAIPQINEAWVGANFTPADKRSDAQRETLALSDTLIDEIKRADVLVIGLPVYNFGAPAALKAWIDQVARAGVTFKYTENGPKGLLEGKRAIVSLGSGGTEMGSAIDFASGYLRHVLGFLGIQDVEFVAADRMSVDADASHAKAQAALDGLAVAA